MANPNAEGIPIASISVNLEYWNYNYLRTIDLLQPESEQGLGNLGL